jgi:hypothetical protein
VVPEDAVRRLLLAVALAAVAGLSAGASAGVAADECNGLMVCIPVAGPWVHVPAPSGASAAVAHWQLICPKGVVGGTDARASERGVTVDFVGELGSPINPGITTRTSAWFEGVYPGPPKHASSFQPFIGCLPSPGGGGRTRTAVPVKPGNGVTVRTRTLKVAPGAPARAAIACRSDERMLTVTHAVGIFQANPPTDAQFASVHVTQLRQGRLAIIEATRSGGVGPIRSDVQIQATCVT